MAVRGYDAVYNRSLEVSVGTSTALFGVDLTPNSEPFIYGILERYLLMETPPQYRNFLGHTVDTAALIKVQIPSDSLWGYEYLLLLLCDKDKSWSTLDELVFVYAVVKSSIFDACEEPLPAHIWEPVTHQLAYYAWFMSAEPPSDMLRLLQRRFKRNL